MPPPISEDSGWKLFFKPPDPLDDIERGAEIVEHYLNSGFSLAKGGETGGRKNFPFHKDSTTVRDFNLSTNNT